MATSATAQAQFLLDNAIQIVKNKKILIRYIGQKPVLLEYA